MCWWLAGAKSNHTPDYRRCEIGTHKSSENRRLETKEIGSESVESVEDGVEIPMSFFRSILIFFGANNNKRENLSKFTSLDGLLVRYNRWFRTIATHCSCFCTFQLLSFALSILFHSFWLTLIRWFSDGLKLVFKSSHDTNRANPWHEPLRVRFN